MKVQIRVEYWGRNRFAVRVVKVYRDAARQRGVSPMQTGQNS
jgi:hypothetical protein